MTTLDTTDKATVDAKMLIGGEWVDAQGRAEATSPATGTRLGSFAIGSAEDVDAAVAAALAAGREWVALGAFARAAILENVCRVVERRGDELVGLLSLEQGKPRAEAAAELGQVLSLFHFYAEEATRLEGVTASSADPSKRVLVQRGPRGVVAAIQPWNYPLSIAAVQVAPALATGNTAVVLPAPTTTLVAFALIECLVEAGVPAGVVNLVTGYGRDIGDALTTHPDVRVVAFTGSPGTGLHITRVAGTKLLLLELGGNGPTVVLDDADLDLAVDAAVSSSFYGAGQSCSAGELFIVHTEIYDEFAERVARAAASRVVLGDPLAPDTTMGPMHDPATADRMGAHIAQATEAGARVLVGGDRADGHPTDLYWNATVLADVSPEMEVVKDETFGPILPLLRVADEDEALARVLEGQYGLASAVFTRDVARGLRFAEQVPAGTVNINVASTWTEPHLPFGGRTGSLSGVGRCQGRQALEAFTEWKTTIVQL